MTTEAEQQIEQEQSDSAMMAGFDAIRNPGSEPFGEDQQQNAGNDSEGDAESDDPSENADEETAEEETRFAGMTESEIRLLLERASKLSTIEEQLSKAHGKIGELNRTLQQLAATQQRPAPAASANGDATVEEQGADVTEIDELFPEFSPAVERKARKIAQEVLQQFQQQSVGQQTQSADPEAINQTVALAVMDATRPKWREVASSDDFKTWLASQPDPLRETYNSTWDPSVVSQMLDSFEAARRSAAERTTKSKTRLEAALLPDSRSSRSVHVATEMDAMQAGFDSVRQPRYYSTRQ